MPRLSLQDPYDRRTREELEEISLGLSEAFHRVSSLPDSDAERAVESLLRRACGATHERLITLGREYLLEANRPWLVSRIERLAESSVNLKDEWDFRRLLELYQMLDQALLARLVEVGLRSSNPAISEAAQDFSK
jgi:hypothetical protein